MPDQDTRADQARLPAERLDAIYLHYAINTHLKDQGVTAPPDIARTVGLPAGSGVGICQ